MQPYIKEISDLRSRVDELEEEIRQIKGDLTPINNPFVGKLGLTNQLACVLLSLYKHDVVSNKRLDMVTAQYGRGFNPRNDDDLHITIRTKVAICKLRAKLKPYDIPLNNIWGFGYSISPEAKVKLAKIVEMDR